MKKLFLISILPVFMFSCSCITKVKAQAPQVLTNVGQIVWQGSSPTTGPCIWQINTLANTISTPCTPGVTYTLPIATTTTLGGIKPDGLTLSVNSTTGVASVIGGSYILPIATSSVLGGIKPDGTTITVNSTTGVASSSSGTSGPPNIYCVSTNSAGNIAQTINCNAFSYNAGDFINYGGTTGGNNGITNMLAYCATLSPTTCYATISPTYAGTDTIPSGYTADYSTPDVAQSTISSNTIIIDERAGTRRYDTNNWCATNFSNQCYSQIEQSVAWNNISNNSPNYFVKMRKYAANAGGCNWNPCLANYTPEPEFFWGYTPGQKILVGRVVKNYSIGDGLNASNSTFCYGGLSGLGTDEGCEREDNITAQGAVAWMATITSGGTSLSSITVSGPTQGAGTLGAERELINQTTGVVTGTATAQTSSEAQETTPALITVSGTPFTPDTVRATIGTATTIGTNVLTTLSFATGGYTNFSTSSLVCLSDGQETERLFPTATSSTSLTLNTKRTHLSTAIITSGSSTCGKDFSFDADNVTNSTYGTIPNGSSTDPTTPVGTLIRAFKVVGSPANNQLMIAWQGKGAYRQIANNSSCCLVSNGNVINGAFHLYPAATILQINAGGSSSGLNSGENGGTLQLYNNNVVFNTNDVVMGLVGPAQLISNGHDIQSRLFASFTQTGGGRGFDYYGIVSGTDTLLSLNVHTPSSFYSSGSYSPPYGISMLNTTSYAMQLNLGETQTFSLACNLLCNNNYYQLISMGDSVGGYNLGKDYLYVNQNLGAWAFTVNNGAFAYWEYPDGMEFPQVANTNVGNVDTGSMLFFYSTTNSCPAYKLPGGSITCFGSGSSNATSIQGNAVASGSFSNSGQAYIWNGSNLAITQTNTLQSGQGTILQSPSVGVQQINTANVVRQVLISTDTISTSDCGGTIIYEYSGTTSVGIPQANSGTGNAVMPTTCFVNLISWTGNTTNLTTSISNFYSILGTNTSQSFSLSATKKQITSAGGNYYQTQ